MPAYGHSLLAFVLVMSATLSGVIAQGDQFADTCGTGEVDEHLLDLSWVQVPAEDSFATVEDGILDLLVSNRSGEPQKVQIRVVADAGTPRKKTLEIPDLVLMPGASRAMPVGLDDFDLDLDVMEFSGFVLAVARVTPFRDDEVDPSAPLDQTLFVSSATRLEEKLVSTEVETLGRPDRPDDDGAPDGEIPRNRNDGSDDQRRLDQFFSPEIYFHRDRPGTSTMVYGSEILMGRFNSGDLLGQVDLDLEDGIVVRTLRGGAGLRRQAPTQEETIPSLEDDGDGAGGPAGDLPIKSNDRRICIKWEIGITDKGKLLKTQNGNWIREDFWSGGAGDSDSDFKNPGPAPANMIVTARGVRVTIAHDGELQTYDADPATGCFTLQGGDLGDTIVMLVWTWSTDEDGNRMKVVTGGAEAPFVFVELIEPPEPGETRTYKVGDYTTTATMAAVSAFASYRLHFGLHDKEIRIRNSSSCSSPGANNSSAHFTSSGLSSGIARVRIHTGKGSCSGDSCDCMDDGCACSKSDHRRWKFLITHEMGHAWMLLAIGENSFEPNVVLNLVDPDEIVCGQGGGYSIGSLEWNALGAREGMAHFYGTDVFNDHASPTAVFTWFGGANDVEFNNPPALGGRLWNNCTTTVKCGKATIIDWLRFWWDWHTEFEQGQKVGHTGMRDVYVQAIKNGDLQKNTYYAKFREAMEQVIASADFRDEWDLFANWNGADTNPDGLPSGLSCIVPYGYPDCDCWEDRDDPVPQECLGIPGCPCLDIDLPGGNFHSQLETEGFFADGEASYVENGLDGPGQHCLDASIDLPDRGAVCGLADHPGKPAPVCEVCGVNTMYGCSCGVDAECGGLDAVDLICWASSDQGWAGSRPGICLPDPNAGDGNGRDRLEEIPWFCLDNCGSKGSDYRCAWDQLEDQPPGIFLDHAQCLDITCGSPIGFCESLAGGAFCDVDAMCPGNTEDEWKGCCIQECETKSDCQLLGYPDHYECDLFSIGTTYGHCVPPECASPEFFNDNQSYCHMFW